MSRTGATTFDLILGQYVRACRTERGMSQDDLARQIGVTFQQVQKYESGRNRLSVFRLLLVAEALDMPAEEMMFIVVERARPLLAELARTRPDGVAVEP